MEPILKGYFSKFKKSYDIPTQEDAVKESETFERFINYTIFSKDAPSVFVGNSDLLDAVSIGGGNDTGIDGFGIILNDSLIKDKDDVDRIVESAKKVEFDFVLIQSKMRDRFDTSELNTFCVGVKNFFTEGSIPTNKSLTEWKVLTDYLYENMSVAEKMTRNPHLYMYYVMAGPEVPDNDHLNGVKQLWIDDLRRTGYYFENVALQVLSGKNITAYCKELENEYSVSLNLQDFIPLKVTDDNRVKKAYSFTCSAREFLKILTSESGELRRSLFIDNVRDYLGNKSSVNKEIEDTIVNSPELFIMCNNGITIVCSNMEIIREKLVRIDNPQIVNGCQTSNTVFNFRNYNQIESVQLTVKLICTDNFEISNKIVRGTNKQNQVLDEAFEATLPYHHELERYFEFQEEEKIYYERRAKQYSSNPAIPKFRIVNLRIITQVFVAMFLDAPHMAHRHEAKLLERFAGKNRQIYVPGHSYGMYYVCALTWMRFEAAFRKGLIDRKLKPFIAHLYLIFRYSVGVIPPSRTNGKSMSKFCDDCIKKLSEEAFMATLPSVLRCFDEVRRHWIAKGNSKFAIKDVEDFTKLLAKHARETFVKKGAMQQSEKGDLASEIKRGTILNIHIKENWYGFIKPEGNGEEGNIYFDERGYKGALNQLLPGVRVNYVETKKDNRRKFAIEVRPI